MIRADVLLEHHDNVTHIDFLRPDLPPPGSGLEEGSPLQPSSPRAAAAGPLPARLSPRPVRVLTRRYTRSQLAGDLREYGWLIGLLVASVVGVFLLDDQITAAAYALLGGPR